MERLGRYYTQELFSSLLVSKINVVNPSKVVDLGVGNGSLVKAAMQRWANITYYAADIDIKSINHIKEKLPFVKSFHLDTLKDNVLQKLKLKKNSVDIAVCNPPFLKINNNVSYDSLFERANLIECKKLTNLSSEVIFLANNLYLLKSGGELGIILPDSLITRNDFQCLRSSILSQYDLKGVIQLPEKIFPKTEALTHILIIGKSQNNNTKTSLFLANKSGQIIEEIHVDKSSLVERMDFKYHSWKNNNRIVGKTLADLRVDIKRGSLTHKQLLLTNDNYIHTTEIENRNNHQNLYSTPKRNRKYLLAEKGDILLSRVGRSIKLCKIGRGKAPISDCVYRIRVSKKFQNKVWKSFISKRGQSWFKANSHGVCAKVISKRDLLNFPINQ